MHVDETTLERSVRQAYGAILLVGSWLLPLILVLVLQQALSSAFPPREGELCGTGAGILIALPLLAVGTFCYLGSVTFGAFGSLIVIDSSSLSGLKRAAAVIVLLLATVLGFPTLCVLAVLLR